MRRGERKEAACNARCFCDKYKSYLPFFLVAAVSVIWHAILTVAVGDDLVYFKTLLDGRSLFEILLHRYRTWSSRLAIEAVLIPIVHCTWLWRILDTVIFASIPVLLDKLLDADERMRWYIAAFVLLYPFSDMMSAGWISTTTNYLWPLWCILFLGVLIKKAMHGGRLRWYEGISGIIACVYASSQEQVAVILLLIFVLYIVHFWGEKRYKLPLLYTMCGINVASLTAILLCPGNAIRKLQEVEGRMPEFAGLTFGEKLYMGLVNIERIFIANVNNLFLVIVATLTVLVYVKTKDYRRTLISGLPVLVLFGQSVIRMSHVRFANIFVVPEQATHWDLHNPATYLPLLLLAVCVFGILYALYQLMRENPKAYICMALLLGCGLASGVVMGFSPTIYASADRPYIYLYFILIFSCLWQFRAVRRKAHMTVAEKLAATVLTLLVLVNIADVTWLCYIMGRWM